MKVALLLLHQVVFTLALTVRSPHTRRLFFPPIAIVSLYLGLSPLRTGLPFPVDYLLACGQLSNLVITADYLIIKDVYNDLRLKDQTTHPATLPFFSRLKWAIYLLCSPRHIGWDQEPSKALPQRWRGYQRTNSINKFTFDQALRLVLYIMLFRLAAICTPRYQYRGGIDLFNLATLIRRLTGVLLGVVPIITLLDGVHCFISLVLVLSRMWQPKDWVPLFGSWHEAYSLRRFWGHTWHQMLRKFTSSYGSLIAKRIFCIEKKSYVYFIVQVFTAFFISAAIHTTADLVFFGDGSGAVYFFLSQAVAVVVEDIFSKTIGVSARWNSVNPLFRQFLGYLWVLTWFILSIPLWRVLFVDNNVTN